MPRAIVCLILVVLILLPDITIAGEPVNIYGAIIHLKNNKKLDGYIETGGFYLYKCNDKIDPSDKYKLTGKSYLERLLEQYNPEGKDKITITYIDRLLEAKYTLFNTSKHEYHNISIPVVAKSSVNKIKVVDIKYIESVCRKWDGFSFDNYTGIPSVTDRMAEIMSDHKSIAAYLYTDEELSKDSGKSCELCGCERTLLSYNPEYTREKLKKLRYKLYKMSNAELEKERLVKFGECWD